MNDLEFRLCLKIDGTILDVWVEQGWLVPDRTDRGRTFAMPTSRGVASFSISSRRWVSTKPVSMSSDLVDQVHGLRGTLRELMEAVRVQDNDVQQRIRSQIDRMKGAVAPDPAKPGASSLS